MKIVVTGAAGQLGYDICRVLAERKIEHIGVDLSDCNITQAESVEALLEREKPDGVIHCAAYTAVDRAEEEAEKVYAVNEGGTRNLAVACERLGAKFLYLSTDYVFPGIGEQFYKTEEKKGPLNVYGKSKLAGEIAVQETMRQYFIVRTSWVFGKNGNNFVKTMLRLAETQDEVGVVADQIGSPTYTADLAPLLCDMIQTEKYGIYHATNEGICSWAEFAEEIFRLTEKNVKVNYLATRDYPVKAVRPFNSRMDKQSLEDAGFRRLPVWQDALDRYIRVLKGEANR